MAATEEAARLSETFLAAQTRMRAVLVGQLRVLWPALSPMALDDTYPAWEQAQRLVLDRWYRTFAGLAARYVREFSLLETGTATQPFVAGTLPAEQVATALRVTGPIAVRRLITSGADAADAAARGFVVHSGAASRLALLGSRQTLQATITNDRRALGFSRVTSGTPCYFCAMLAGRGPIYKTERAAIQRRDGHRYHDHCVCFAEPVYRKGAAWPGRAREYRALWHDSVGGRTGQDAINAFRRAFEAAA